MRRILLALTMLATPLTVNATDNIYFYMISDNKTYTFMNFTPQVAPMMQDIAIMTLDRPFSSDLIHKDFYQLSITYGIVWNNFKAVQYDYKPLSDDRFRNVIWLTADKKAIIKVSIYDNAGRLIFDAICMNSPIPIKETPDALVRALSRNDFIYKGFALAHAEFGPNDTYKMLFSDGLNRFSVFKTLATKAEENREMIIYGNYVYNKIVGDYIYTAVGTIPYEIMEEVIEKLDELAQEGLIPASGGV